MVLMRNVSYDGFKVTHSLVYDDEARKGHSRTTTVDFNSTTYLKEISRSRTYGFMEELEALKKNSLALGAVKKMLSPSKIMKS